MGPRRFANGVPSLDINAGTGILGPSEPVVSGYRIVIELDAGAWRQHEQP